MNRSWLVLTLLAGLCCSPAFAQKQHGFDNARPSGQPYLTPDESLKRMKVPPGWEVKLFAAEPDIINPVSFTVDERGRLWVVECYEYPKRTPKGQKPRDRIKILEDTTGAGKADKVTLWAEGKDFPTGFDLATGIEVGHGGAFLGAAPYLFYLQDKADSGHCDTYQTLLAGFGSQDTHELLNTMQWGPDGRLHGLHGIFTRSQIGEVKLDAAVWRYDVAQKKFDLLAEGTSNPWGLDFDQYGQAFLAACVIPHAYHIIPGGRYIRQAGGSQNPYAYELLREISDHQHHAESGWAHAGALVLQGDTIPVEYRGSLLMGSIHGCSIKRDILVRRGSSYTARHAPDFLVSGDKNFRPINIRWGPDGSIYVIDWHDQNPCHQAPHDSWDMTRGRIYKIQRAGAKSTPTEDLFKKSSAELVELLTNNDPWRYRTALRLLSERKDKSVVEPLRMLALTNSDEAVALRGLWGLYAVDALDDQFAEKALARGALVRAWTIRLLGEAGRVSDKMLRYFEDTAARPVDVREVRLQLACTAQRLTTCDTVPLLHNLMTHADDAADPCIPAMIWLAYEPRLSANPSAELAWLQQHAVGNALVTEKVVPFAMRRLVATEKAADLSACLAFLEAVKDSGVRRRGLQGLVFALQNRQLNPPDGWQRARASLVQDPDAEVRTLVGRLAVNFRDVEAIRSALATARNPAKPTVERLGAVRDLALAHPPEALAALEELVGSGGDADLCCEACRALTAYEDAAIPKHILAGWKSFPPTLRTEVVQLLAGRKNWAKDLLDAVGSKQVPSGDLNGTTILRVRSFRDPELNKRIEEVWGQVRDTPAEINALIDKKRDTLYAGRASAARGKKIFEAQCAKCHKFEGQGHEVGPNLDGAARDLEYLLVNILDPDRVVGQPYFLRLVELKNGRVETGMLAAEDEQSVTLKGENDTLKVIQKKDIEGKVLVQTKSVMPEGLANGISVQDFRDLLRYLQMSPFCTQVALAGPVDPTTDVARITTWTTPVIGAPGRIELPPAAKEAVTFVKALVTAPAAFSTRLLLGSAGPVEVWLNGVSVYRGTPGASPVIPDQAGVDVALRPGGNQLVLRAVYQGDKSAVFVRLLDPNRKLVLPEPTEK